MKDRLPEDIEAERAVLASLAAAGTLDPDSRNFSAHQAVLALRPEFFVHPAHKAVCRAIKALYADGQEINSLVLKAKLEEHGDLGKVGGFPGLVELLSAEEVGRPGVLVDRLLDLWRARQTIILGGEIQRRGVEAMEPVEALISFAADRLAKIAQASNKATVRMLNQTSDEVLARVLDRMEGRDTVGTRLHGWTRLNGITRGFQPGQLIVLAARPGIGKTALALNWALRAALYGHRVFYASLEMTEHELIERLISDRAGVDERKMISDRDYEAFSRYGTAKAELDQLPIHLCDRASVTVPEIVGMVDQIVAQNGPLGLVVVDYLQLLSSPSGSKKDSEHLRLGEMTRGLKLMGKDRNVPVILLSQLNREVEKRNGNRPQLSDLRDSGSIESDADLVMFIHRRMEETKSDLIIAKHRNGPSLTMSIEFKPEITRYVEVERSTEAPHVDPCSAAQEAALMADLG